VNIEWSVFFVWVWLVNCYMFKRVNCYILLGSCCEDRVRVGIKCLSLKQQSSIYLNEKKLLIDVEIVHLSYIPS